MTDITSKEIDKTILKNKSSVNIVLPKERIFDINSALHIVPSKYNAHMNNLIKYDDIDETLYLISECKFDYITTTGKVYVYYGNGMFYKRSNYINKHNGYVYTNVRSENGNKQKRLHILLAKTFIPNEYPLLLKLVGHKDDKKENYCLENLYWTNNQENTKDAFKKGINKQLSAEDNKNSFLIKVLDKNTLNIVGVYGSIRECARCIKNITEGTISKMCKNEKMYKPRSRKYIYQKTTQEDFIKYRHLKSVKLIETKPADKSPKIFYLCNDKIGYKEEFDNQTKASKICGLSQAEISHMIKSGSIKNDWYCIYKGTTTYKESSGYDNMINNLDIIVLKNIYNDKIKTYNTSEELKKEFNLSGHDIGHYFKSGHMIMNEWKLIEYKNRNKLKT